ncbi:hypothetical protein ES703_122243 [subsurface metagenome]
MGYPPPAQIGDMEQAIQAAQIHEDTEVGDILHAALKNLSNMEIGDETVFSLLQVGLHQLFT